MRPEGLTPSGPEVTLESDISALHWPPGTSRSPSRLTSEATWRQEDTLHTEVLTKVSERGEAHATSLWLPAQGSVRWPGRCPLDLASFAEGRTPRRRRRTPSGLAHARTKTTMALPSSMWQNRQRPPRQERFAVGDRERAGTPVPESRTAPGAGDWRGSAFNHLLGTWAS